MKWGQTVFFSPGFRLPAGPTGGKGGEENTVCPHFRITRLNQWLSQRPEAEGTGFTASSVGYLEASYAVR
jgi:hypothetical protein